MPESAGRYQISDRKKQHLLSMSTRTQASSHANVLHKSHALVNSQSMLKLTSHQRMQHQSKSQRTLSHTSHSHSISHAMQQQTTMISSHQAVKSFSVPNSRQSFTADSMKASNSKKTQPSHSLSQILQALSFATKTQTSRMITHSHTHSMLSTHFQTASSRLQ